MATPRQALAPEPHSNGCKTCDRAGCTGAQNKLRSFADWSDIADHVDEDMIVTWVNRYARLMETRRLQARRNQLKQRLTLKMLEERLGVSE